MATRDVKSVEAALSRTYKPLVAEAKTMYDGLENVISGLGTSKDKSQYSQYKLAVPIDRIQLEAMYRQSWLAKRIINTIPEDMTRKWLKVMFDATDKESQKAIEKAEKKYSVISKTCDALQWGRLYGGAIMVINIKGQALNTPLNMESIKEGSLVSLVVLDRHRVSGSPELTKELDSPNFGLPEFYMVAESSVQIHHTRAIRFNGQKLPYWAWQQNSRWDDSELQHVKESLIAKDGVYQSVNSMMFEASIDIVTIENFADIIASKNGESNTVKRFALANLMKSFNRMLLLDSKEKFERHQMSFANIDKILSAFVTDVCGAADTPATRLFGQSPGGLNAPGDGELRNYYDMVSAKQERELRPQMEYLYQILCMSTLGKIPDDFELMFNPLWQESPKQIADTNKVKADTSKVYYDMGVLHEGTIARQIKADGAYSEMTDEDVDLAEELAMEPDPEVDPATGEPVVKTATGEENPNAINPQAEVE